jgi:hypothetical protein
MPGVPAMKSLEGAHDRVAHEVRGRAKDLLAVQLASPCQPASESAGDDLSECRHARVASCPVVKQRAGGGLLRSSAGPGHEQFRRRGQLPCVLCLWMVLTLRSLRYGKATYQATSREASEPLRNVVQGSKLLRASASRFGRKAGLGGTAGTSGIADVQGRRGAPHVRPKPKFISAHEVRRSTR